MLNENTTSAVQTAQADVGLIAFRVAVVQAKAFEERLAEVNDRKAEEIRAEKTKKEAEEKNSTDESQKLREAQAQERGGVDIVVDSSQSGVNQLAEEVVSSSKGHEVDIEV